MSSPNGQAPLITESGAKLLLDLSIETSSRLPPAGTGIGAPS